MSQTPEHASLSPVAFDRDGFRLSVEPELRSTPHSPVPPPKTPTPMHSRVDINVVEAPRPSLAVLIIKPHAVKQRLKIEKRIVEAGFEIVKERKMGFHLESPGIVEMFASDAPSLSGDPVWVYVLSRARATSALTALAGPVDPLAARKSDPESLRALYGSNRWENGVWITRDESGADRVVGELFAGSPIMEFSDLPSVNGSPDRRRIRKATSHASSIKSEFTDGSGSKGFATSVSGASLTVPTKAAATAAAKPGGFKARPVPSTIATPSIVPRTTRAADLRAGGAAAAAAAISPPRQRQSQEERERTFEGVPGHKRRESISVASTAPPAIAPRPNRSAQLRAQKLAEAVNPKTARRQSMIDFPVTRERKEQLSPEELEERNRATFEGVPGHKRRESISVASTAPPAVAPRVNRSSILRAQKMVTAVGSGGPPSSFKGALEASSGSTPARSLSTRSSRTSVSVAPSGTTGRTSVSGVRSTVAKPVPSVPKASVVTPTESANGSALTPISNSAMTPRSVATPTTPAKPLPGSPKKPDIVPRTNKSALLRAAAKLKSAAGSMSGSMGRGTGRKSLAT